MRASSPMAVAALIVAVLSLLGSALAIWYARRSALANEVMASANRTMATVAVEQRSDELARQAEEANRQLTAILTLSISKSGKNHHTLRLRNRGPAVARDVWLDAVASLGGSTTPTVHIEPPRRKLHAGESWDMPIMLAGADNGVECIVQWTDGTGEHQDRVQGLS